MAVFFIGMLLLKAGVEPNPGPPGKVFSFRYQYLLIEVGTSILRKVFDFQVGPGDFKQYLDNHSAAKQQLLFLINRNKITAEQQQLLPPVDNSPSSSNFDIVLLCCLLRHACGLRVYSHTVWINPSPTDTSIEALIYRLKECRNKLMHSGSVFDSETDLNAKWLELCSILTHLGNYCGIDNLESLIDKAKMVDIGEHFKDQDVNIMSRIERQLDHGKKTTIQLDNIEQARKGQKLSDDEEVKKYEDNLDAMATLAEVLEKGNEHINAFRVMVIGCFGQGKTSLVNKLLSKSLVEPQSTNGIDIHSYVGNGTGHEWIEKPLIAPEDELVHRLVPVARTLPDKNDDVIADTGDDMSIDASMFNSSANLVPLNPFLSSSALINATPDVKTSHPQSPVKSLEQQSSHKGKTLTQVLGRKFKEACNNDTKSNESLTGINVWDFGGEYVFYATHQLFLCRHAVYLLVFRLDVPLDDVIPDDDYPGSVKPHQRTMREYIEFWMSSVHAFVGNAEGNTPTVILVGTHKDKLDKTEIATEYFESIRQMFDERILRHHIYETCFAVSTIKNDPITKLRKAIMDIYEKQIKLIKVPVKWISLENDLGKRREEDVLSLNEVIDLDERGDYSIGRQQVTIFLQHHHDIGTVFFISEGTPIPYVILNPQFVADAFKCVITAKKFFLSHPKLRDLWNKLSDKAILDSKLLDCVWDGQRFKEHKHLLQECLVKLRVMGKALRFDENGKFTPLDYFIVPSMLRSHSNDEVRTFLQNRPRTLVSLLYEFKDEAILPSMYHRFTAAAIGTWPILKYEEKEMLFANCSAYKLDYIHCGLMKQERNCLEILVVQLCTDQGIAKEVPDRFRRYFEYILQDIINSSECRTQIPVSKRFKCMHETHDENGTIESYPIEIMDKVGKVSCPDHKLHDAIDIADVLKTWFGHGHESVDSDIPAKRPNKEMTSSTLARGLTKIEMIQLSEAIGDNWEILGHSLGVSDVKIQHIKSDNRTTEMKIFSMLKQWSQSSDAATLDVLVNALEENKSVSWNPNIVQDIVRNANDGFSKS